MATVTILDMVNKSQKLYVFYQLSLYQHYYFS